MISASGSERQARANAGEQAVDRLRREQARRAAADEHAHDLASPHRAAARTRGRPAAHRRSASSGTSPRASCELKSQYGHLRTHHGMCTYSASGGSAREALGFASAIGDGAHRARASLQLRDQRAHRLAAMRQLVLARERQLGAGHAGREVLEVRVVAEAAARRAAHRRCAPCQRPSAIIGSGSLRMAHQHQHARVVRAPVGDARERGDQLLVVARIGRWRRPHSAPTARRARRRAPRRRRRNRRRAPAASRSVLACRALASAFSTNVTCGSSASAMPSSAARSRRCRAAPGASRNSRSLPALPRREHQAVRSPCGERRPLRRDERRGCRASASAEQRVHLRARERRAFGGALQLDEAAARRSSRRSCRCRSPSPRRSRGRAPARRRRCPPTPRPRTRAAGRRRRGRARGTTRCASATATHAPVIDAQRVPPSACSTSQSILSVRSPSAGKIGDRAQAAADQALDLLRAARLPCPRPPRAGRAYASRAAACRTRR